MPDVLSFVCASSIHDSPMLVTAVEIRGCVGAGEAQAASQRVVALHASETTASEW